MGFVTAVDDLHTSFSKENKEKVLWGPSEVLSRHGVPPRRLVDMTALAGDSADNIRGVHGVGPKKALELLRVRSPSLIADAEDMYIDALLIEWWLLTFIFLLLYLNSGLIDLRMSLIGQMRY